jgi:predicted Ser/Thr protein kinase
MSLRPGQRLGPYEILSALGAGGMGEVFRARDARLGRDVAIKVLPPERADDPAFRRFEQEARAAGALNHPHVLAVFDVGREGDAPYMVTELLEGQTLRERMVGELLPVRKAVEIADEIAQGLAAAHERGIVHRDLKPENVFITRDGRVKIIDFGLAKLNPPLAETGETATLDTSAPATGAGTVLGTVGYMSPEQARGNAADHHADIFALGAVLYEMLSGRRAFRAASAVETLHAILREDPPPLPPERGIPLSVDRIVRRCLEKHADERFQSARDLAFALESLSVESRTESRPVTEVDGVPARERLRLRRLVAPVLLVALLAGAFALGRRSTARAMPTFTPLTFRRGTVLDARFTADGHTVVYSSLWDGNPPEIFSLRLDGLDSTSLGLPPARLLGLSSEGELAILVAKAGDARGDWQGTLARVPLSGGPPRAVLDDVWSADWSPDGRELAVVRLVDGEARLEYPIGHVLRRGLTFLQGSPQLRMSPRGDRLALHSDEGVAIVDREGRSTVIPLPPVKHGLAWAADGDELWVLAGAPGAMPSLWGGRAGGQTREIARWTMTFLHDVARDGRLLAHQGFERVGVRAAAPRETVEREMGVLAGTLPIGFSSDGSQLLLMDFGLAGRSFLRPTRGGPPLLLARGRPLALSADGAAVLVDPGWPGPPKLLLTPTGAGESRALSTEGLETIESAWLAAGGRAVLNASARGGRRRAFVVDAAGGKPVPVTPEGVLSVSDSLSEGTILGWGGDGTLARYRLADGTATPVAARVPKQTYPLRLSADARSVFLAEPGVPGRIDRLDVATGRRTPWKVLRPDDAAGVFLVDSFQVTGAGEAYAYSYQRFLQDLLLVRGVR